LDCPIRDLLDEQAWYAFLVGALRSQGLRCPGCRGSRYATHCSRRDSILDYRCADCGRDFNAWTGTLLQGTQRTPARLALVVRGFANGTSSARLPRELGCSRRHLLDLRHRDAAPRLGAPAPRRPGRRRSRGRREIPGREGGKGCTWSGAVESSQGTGLGSALVANGAVWPMELGHLSYRKRIYEDYVGPRGLKRLGKKNKWKRHVAFGLARLMATQHPDDIALGGGNVKKLRTLPPGCRAGDNKHAFRGGFRMWERVDAKDEPPAKGGELPASVSVLEGRTA
jgi:transposase-like protein